ncbi:disulfide bond formation protein DsbA [Flavobacterium sp. L1I52]|uniref:Disulfide bond formation protein DsbA n=1 Tax=Flavobacterium pokkalii TaxID=1940408 RepID=A0ABR7US50_9FLAO|nr:DsbA family oxidoreductase [Flavobacterium pokkalii]MBD0725717.1 disulfide bond formation protein DsbA [Flavobacterium pokkalii]
MENKLKIQIWSDIMCPFCYIGKRRLENAIDQFGHQDAIEIEWKSFQLDPNFIASEGDNLAEHLAEKYRKDQEWALESLKNTAQTAANSGLEFHFEKVTMANSFNAHRLLHLAKQQQLGSELKELLFKAYFTDGKDVNDTETLKELAIKAGLEAQTIDSVLTSDAFDKEVQQDILRAQQIGVQGVPFFVFDNKYAVSGAQYEQTFLNVLEKVWEEGQFQSKITILNSSESNSCNLEGCD